MNKESTQGKGVSDCYVFKSRLQEYAQKVGFSTPVYETIKEGPSHEPLFRSTVVVNDARYDSLPGFFNRKAAEQSAAEIALLELAKCGDKKESIAQPVHEIGLCKNLLQEYAQKMNYAMPTYECKKEDKEGRGGHFSCIVEIGSIRYIGAVARTKKEAEIKAARTALLAIQTSPSEMGESLDEETKFTVVPCKRKEPEPITPKQEVVKTRKTKKSRLKKKPFKKQQVGNKNGSQVGNANTELGTELQAVVPSGNGSLDVPISNTIQNHGNTAASEGLLNPDVQISAAQPISMNGTPGPPGHGLRSRTRDSFSRPFKKKGYIHLTTYLRTFHIGDYVDVKVNGAIHKGMPHKFYHGRTGRVWNVTKRAVGVEINKQVNGRIIRKRIHVRIEHVLPSRCTEDFKLRIKKNDQLKADAKARGVVISTKRQPEGPKPGFMVDGATIETVTPIPYDVVNDLKGGY